MTRETEETLLAGAEVDLGKRDALLPVVVCQTIGERQRAGGRHVVIRRWRGGQGHLGLTVVDPRVGASPGLKPHKI